MKQLAAVDGLTVRDPSRSYLRADAWATVRGAAHRIYVMAKIGDTEPRSVQALDGSRAAGGSFPPHVSHRTGRDLDITRRKGGAEYPADDSDVRLFVAELAPALEVVGSTRPLPVDGVKVSAWDGHSNHLHLRWPSATISQRLSSAALKAYQRPTKRNLERLSTVARAALLALDGAPDDADVIAVQVARAELTKLANAELVDGPAAARGIKAFLAVIGDSERLPVETAAQAIAKITPKDVAVGVGKAAVNALGGAASLVGAGVWALAGPVIAAVVALAVVAGVVVAALKLRGPSTSWADDYTDREIRSLYAKTLKPPGRRSREAMVAELAEVPDLDSAIAEWKA